MSAIVFPCDVKEYGYITSESGLHNLNVMNALVPELSPNVLNGLNSLGPESDQELLPGLWWNYFDVYFLHNAFRVGVGPKTPKDHFLYNRNQGMKLYIWTWFEIFGSNCIHSVLFDSIMKGVSNIIWFTCSCKYNHL